MNNETPIRITVGGSSLNATLSNNPAARSLISQLPFRSTSPILEGRKCRPVRRSR